MDLNQWFDDQLAEKLAPEGFVRSRPAWFVRQRNELEQTFTAGPIPSQGAYRITLGAVGVRLFELERIMSQVRSAPNSIGTPIHLLRPERAFKYWMVTDEKEASTVLPIVVATFREFGLPFLERWKRPGDIRISLQSSNPQDWFMCTPDSRNAYLVTFEYLENGREAAQQLGDELLRQLSEKPRKYSNDLRRTLTVIAALDGSRPM